MNLVAKEGPLVNERDGVLVLSENAGAHEELGEWAVTRQPVRRLGSGRGAPRGAVDGRGRAPPPGRGDPRPGAGERRRALARRACSPTWIASRRNVPASAMSELSHVDERARCRMVDVGAKPAQRRRAVARGDRPHGARDAAQLRDAAEGRRADDGAARGDHGREAHERADPALSSAAADARRGRARGRRGRGRDHRVGGDDRADRRRDGGADGGVGRRADGLRHGEGDRQADDVLGRARREDEGDERPPC